MTAPRPHSQPGCASAAKLFDSIPAILLLLLLFAAFECWIGVAVLCVPIIVIGTIYVRTGLHFTEALR